MMIKNNPHCTVAPGSTSTDSRWVRLPSENPAGPEASPSVGEECTPGAGGPRDELSTKSATIAADCSSAAVATSATDLFTLDVIVRPSGQRNYSINQICSRHRGESEHLGARGPFLEICSYADLRS